MWASMVGFLQTKRVGGGGRRQAGLRSGLRSCAALLLNLGTFHVGGTKPRRRQDITGLTTLHSRATIHFCSGWCLTVSGGGLRSPDAMALGTPLFSVNKNGPLHPSSTTCRQHLANHRVRTSMHPPHQNDRCAEGLARQGGYRGRGIEGADSKSTPYRGAGAASLP